MSRKIIVTTTVSAPTEALHRYRARPGWHLIVAGDLNTPHHAYRGLDNLTYLDPDEQERRYPELSAAIGWNTPCRRNIAFIEAYRRGAEVMATVDDDNVPYDHWGTDLLVGKEVSVDYYETDNQLFDPLCVTEHRHLWHRGYPIHDVPCRSARPAGRRIVRCGLEAGLWDGDPDVDAVCRLAFHPNVKFSIERPYAANKPSPFGSQNLVMIRDLIPLYMVLPHVGRMDDIWGSYLLQPVLARMGLTLVFTPPTVVQRRHAHDLITDLELEMPGYRHTQRLLAASDPVEVLPEATRRAYVLYRAQFAEPEMATK